MMQALLKLCMFAMHDLFLKFYSLAALTHLIALLDSQSYLLRSDANQVKDVLSYVVQVNKERHVHSAYGE